MNTRLLNPPIPHSHIMTDDLIFRIDKVSYYWFGGFGAVFKSQEWKVKKGNLRVIGGVIFKAYLVGRENKWQFWKKPTICWACHHDVDMDWIREFKKAIFGVS